MPSLPSDPGPVLATVSRSGNVESWHRGAVAVWHEQDLWLSIGDVASPVFCRSAVKPLQALPSFDRGIPARLGLTAAEIALMCASHDGTDRHVAVVRRFLALGGLHEDMLGCGPHAPFDTASRIQAIREGKEPLKVHNNCSGKHTGFLHLAAACGDDLAGYLDPSCRSQREVHDAVAAMAGVAGPIPTGIDGCGAPTFMMPLAALARSFAQLAQPVGQGAVRAAACQSIFEAAGREPALLAGEKRFCAALLRTMPQRMFAKNGAEGVYAVALAPDPQRRRCPGSVGIAIKISDGSERGYQPVVVDLLRHLGVWEGAVPASLQPWHVQSVKNTRGIQVGDVRCVFDWQRAQGPA